MFEDATFHSRNLQHSQIVQWMLLTLGFNLTIVTAMVLVPLLHPDGLPSHLFQQVLYAPPNAAPMQMALRSRAASATAPQLRSLRDLLQPPRIVPIDISRDPESFSGTPAPFNSSIGDGAPGGVAGGDANERLFQSSPPVVVRPAPAAKLRLSEGVAEGLILSRTKPIYPPIAIAARVSGTVVLAATISTSGTIENLRVVSGNAMLQQSALNAVRSWRYRPYLLNNQPVEVETTIDVVFSLGNR